MLTDIDYLTPEKSHELIEKITNPKHRLLVLLMHDAGLRVSEAISLTIEDFDFRKKIISVRSLKKRNKGQRRAIPMSNRLFKAMATYLQGQRISGGWLFPSDKSSSGHVTRDAAFKILARFKKKNAGFSNLHPHTLRHTAATNLLAQGTALPAIKDYLGHENIQTTTVYTHTPLEVVRQQIEKANSRELSLTEKVVSWFKKPEAETTGINIGQKNTFVIGRADELDQLQNNIRKNINTIILGSIGVGKSTLLENVHTDKKVLLVDDTTDFKATLVNALMHLFRHDKEAVMRMMYPKHTIDSVRTPLSRHSKQALAKLLIDTTEQYEYVLIIDNVDRVTPQVVKILETLKDHFTIITTARAVALNKSSFLWNFETIKIQPLSRGESLEMIHKLAYDVELEDKELFRNHIWEQSSGNPRVIFELIERYRKETFVTNDIVREVRHYGALREWDLSFLVLLALTGLAILRYLAYETGDSSLKFIGGVAMILLIVFRQFFTRLRRRYIK